MNLFAFAMALLALSVAIDTALMAALRIDHLGRFKILRDDGKASSFVSSTGAFSVNHQEQILAYRLRRSARPGSLPLQQVAILRYSASDDHALAQEVLFGFDLADLLPLYRDSVETYAIHLTTTSGEAIPLYVRAIPRRRELFMGWYVRLQDRWLERSGLASDVRERSNAALALIKTRLRK